MANQVYERRMAEVREAVQREEALKGTGVRCMLCRDHVFMKPWDGGRMCPNCGVTYARTAVLRRR